MAGTFDKTYTGVTWTEGDIATETKMDNMVNNDQAHDAYASQGITLNNAVQLVGRETGGTARDLIKLSASDDVVVGSASVPTVILSSSGWINVSSFSNSWVNFGASHNSAGYFKDSFGIVHLRGLIKDGTVADSPSSIIFTLPSGFRPAKEILIAIAAHGASGVLKVAATGAVSAISGSNSWFSLENASFYADGS